MFSLHTPHGTGGDASSACSMQKNWSVLPSLQLTNESSCRWQNEQVKHLSWYGLPSAMMYPPSTTFWHLAHFLTSGFTASAAAASARSRSGFSVVSSKGAAAAGVEPDAAPLGDAGRAFNAEALRGEILSGVGGEEEACGFESDMAGMGASVVEARAGDGGEGGASVAVALDAAAGGVGMGDLSRAAVGGTGGRAVGGACLRGAIGTLGEAGVVDVAAGGAAFEELLPRGDKVGASALEDCDPIVALSDLPIGNEIDIDGLLRVSVRSEEASLRLMVSVMRRTKLAFDAVLVLSSCERATWGEGAVAVFAESVEPRASSCNDIWYSVFSSHASPCKIT